MPVAASGKWAGLDASANDASYLAADVPMSSIASHASHLHYLYTHGNHEGMRILEVGSREVTGPSAGRQMFTKLEIPRAAAGELMGARQASPPSP